MKISVKRYSSQREVHGINLHKYWLCLVTVLSSQVINSKQSNLGLTQESLRMVTARVLVVLSGSFTSQIETGPTLT